MVAYSMFSILLMLCAHSAGAQLVSTITLYPSVCSAIYTSGSQSVTIVQSTVTTTATPSPPQLTDQNANAGMPFVLAVQSPATYGEIKRQARRVWLMENGNTTESGAQAARYYIQNGQLRTSSGGYISTSPGVTSQMFAVSYVPGAINTLFSIDNGQLTWQNAQFVNGTAQLFKIPAGFAPSSEIIVSFNQDQPNSYGSWSPVALLARAVSEAMPSQSALQSMSVMTSIIMPGSFSSATQQSSSAPTTVSPPQSNPPDYQSSLSMTSSSSNPAASSLSDLTTITAPGTPIGPNHLSLTGSTQSAAGYSQPPIYGSSSSSSQAVSISSQLPTPVYGSSQSTTSSSLSQSPTSQEPPPLYVSTSSINVVSSPSIPVMYTQSSTSTVASTLSVASSSTASSFGQSSSTSSSSIMQSLLVSSPTIVYGQSTSSLTATSSSPASSSRGAGSSSIATSTSSLAPPVYSQSSLSSSRSIPATTSSSSTLTSPVYSQSSVSSAVVVSISSLLPPNYASSSSSLVASSSSSSLQSSSSVNPSTSAVQTSSIVSPPNYGSSSSSSVATSSIASSSPLVYGMSSGSTSSISISTSSPSPYFGSSSISIAPSSTTSSSSSINTAASSYNSISSSSNSNLATSAIISSASATASYTAPTYYCPGANNQVVTDNWGVQYVIGCAQDSTYASYESDAASTSWDDCFLACHNSTTTQGIGKCTAFTYSGGTNGVGAGTCFLKDFGGVSFVGSGPGLVAAIQLAYFANSTSSSSLSMSASIATSTSQNAPGYSAQSSTSPVAILTSSSQSAVGYAPTSTASSSLVALTSSAATTSSTQLSSSTLASSSSSSAYLVLASPTPCDFGDPARTDEDDSFCEIDLPFSMSMYSTASQRTFASTNGYLSLINGSAQYVVEPLPDKHIPSSSVAALFDDLFVYGNSSLTQGIFYQLNSTGITYEWYVSKAGSPSAIAHFTVGYSISAPGVFTYTYYNVESGSNGSNGQTAVVGMQGLNSGGSAVYSQYSYMTSSIFAGSVIVCNSVQNSCARTQ